MDTAHAVFDYEILGRLRNASREILAQALGRPGSPQLTQRLLSPKIYQTRPSSRKSQSCRRTEGGLVLPPARTGLRMVSASHVVRAASYGRR
jgi:hypothetical protein